MVEPVDRAGIGQGFDNIMPQEGEAGVLGEMGKIGHIAGHQIVPNDNLMPLGKQGIREMRANEPRPACDQNTHVRSSSITTQ
jgi:hypothetical protein